ncbi:hypothetical protein Pmani_008986 [Petrolisthes manimaculis]|uniref:Uncharacterized protein n=1 Tax=Petrolisthes manimaculis TaxID=1843537 RepID=A0AAE1UDD6_9EUCA|nr:hypothetical protein Pmani_008986 [Petrolisthes manimaculis]
MSTIRRPYASNFWAAILCIIDSLARFLFAQVLAKWCRVTSWALTSTVTLGYSSFRENGIGSLDARVTLQYSCGRPKRSLTLNPPKANTHLTPNQHHHHTRDQQPPQPPQQQHYRYPSSNNTTRWSPETTADTNHCQIGPSKLYNSTKVDLDLHLEASPSKPRLQEKEEEGILPTPGSSVEEDSPLELRFIDEDSCETCPSSPISHARLEDELLDEDKSNGGGRVASQLTTRETLSSLAMLGSEAVESTIHSPD